MVLLWAGLHPGSAGAAVYYGDLHSHSGLSNDATGSPDGLFLKARDLLDLDFVALTDHDAFLTMPEWEVLRQTAASFHEPGEFITFTGVEWTHRWHMNAYFLSDEVALCPSQDCPEAVDFYNFHGPAVAAGQAAAHVTHPADVFKVYWDQIDDDVTTNVEVWNSGANGDHEPGFGNALWALRAGFRLGLLGVSDDHHTDQSPALLGTGLTACRGETLSRAILLDELRARRCWATNGARIDLDLSVSGQPMGAVLQAQLGSRLPIEVRVLGSGGPLVIEVLQGGDLIARRDCEAAACTLLAEAVVDDPNDFVHVRVQETGGGRAFASPVWIEGLCGPDQACFEERVRSHSATRNDCMAGWLLPEAEAVSPGSADSHVTALASGDAQATGLSSGGQAAPQPSDGRASSGGQAARSSAERRLPRIICQDGDPACDGGGIDGECRVRLGLCFGATDPTSSCESPRAETMLVRRSGDSPDTRDSSGYENAATLRAIHRAWVSSETKPACSPLAEFRAPVGRTRLGIVAVGDHARDGDGLAIDCLAPVTAPVQGG